MGTIFDSLSGFFQLEPRSKYKPSPFMFMYVISFHTFYLAVAGMFFTGEHSKAIHLFLTSEAAFKDQVILTLANVLGLIFIFIGVGLLGPIKLAFITSSRKVFSVIASILFFNKQISVAKLVGIVLVLAGMIAENFVKDKKEDQKTKDNDHVVKTAETGARHVHKSTKSKHEDEPTQRNSKN